MAPSIIVTPKGGTVAGTLQQFVAASPAEVNSATEVYFQVGGDEADDWVLLTLLSQGCPRYAALCSDDRGHSRTTVAILERPTCTTSRLTRGGVAARLSTRSFAPSSA